MNCRLTSSARQFQPVDQTLMLDQVADSRRTLRVKEGSGSFGSVSAAFGPAGPIHLRNSGSEAHGWLHMMKIVGAKRLDSCQMYLHVRGALVFGAAARICIDNCLVVRGILEPCNMPCQNLGSASGQKPLNSARMAVVDCRQAGNAREVDDI